MTAALSPPPVTRAMKLSNEHASPSRMSSNDSSPAGSPTMNRIQLAKERREEREKGQDLAELLRWKDLRAQQQMERSAEERGRKMEEQRRRETERRVAAEDRRRQRGAEDKRNEQERLEAAVRRRNRQARDAPLENRPKRWTWGGPPGGDGNLKTAPSHTIGSALPNELPAAASPSQSTCDFLTPPTSDPPITKRLSNSSANLHSPERGSPGPQRAFRGSPNRKSIAGPPDDNRGAPTPTMEKCSVPCLPDSPMRRMESPTTPTRSSSPRSQNKGMGTPKRVRSTKNRAQSPCSPGQYPPSPLRQRASIADGNQDRGHGDGRGHGTLEKKTSRQEEKRIPKSSSRELGAESPGTPTGRYVAGTTDAEEASRLLAERRRLARVQKEQEERQRLEDERLREEEERRRQEEEREREERAAQLAEEERERREEERRSREEEERRMKERRWKDMQEQLDREREEAFLRAQREAERKSRERELLHIQEEQERLQRKKRIEEIMKRTRKSEADSPGQDLAGVSGVRGQADGEVEEDAGVEVAPLSAPPDSPHITLGPLETKSCGDELSDGVQSMDVSPVSRDELVSSPVSEGLNSVSVSNARTLEQLLDLTAQRRAQHPPFPPAAVALGDLNKNLLIQGFCPAPFASPAPFSSPSPFAGPAPDSAPSQLLLSSGPGALDLQ